MTATTGFPQSTPPSPGSRPPEVRRWLALAVLCLSVLITTLDTTVLNVVLPTLVRRLGATTTELQWIVDTYVIVYAGLVLVSGSVADRVGRQRMFLTGLALFAAGSAWAAFSGSVNVLIAARASMGIGGALVEPTTLAIITSIFTAPAERQRAIGFWAGSSGVGVALGPIIGGLLLAHFWWGSVFLINVPVALIALACSIALVPDSRDQAAPAPDLPGALMSIAGLGLLVWAIIEAPGQGWTSARFIGACIGGLVVLAAFAIWERRSSHPMLNLEFFRHREFSWAIGSAGMSTIGLFGALFVLTQLLQFDLGYTPLQAGIRTLPAAGAIAVVAPLSALLQRAVGTRLTVAAGLFVVCAGLWQLSLATATATYADTVAGIVILGSGAGLVLPAATASAMGSVPASNTGVGSATNGTVLQLGGALGVAIIGSLLTTSYTNKMTTALAPYHVPHAIRQTILGSVGGALDVAAREGGTLGHELEQAARSAFVSGMDLGMLTGAVIAVVAGVLALVFIPGWPGHRHDGQSATSQGMHRRNTRRA
jgi:EmrB/QacA subfamily drug resistance transporter